MSNIKKTSSDIKKKLSFGDYSAPADKQEDKKVEQSVDKQVARPTDMPVDKHADMQTKHPTDIPARKKAVDLKTKATYYLGKEEKKMITNMYIDRLKKHGKADRSALVCEAIRLLHEKEK